MIVWVDASTPPPADPQYMWCFTYESAQEYIETFEQDVASRDQTSIFEPWEIHIDMIDVGTNLPYKTCQAFLAWLYETKRTYPVEVHIRNE